VTVGVQWTDATQAADAAQASYFRGFLADEGEHVSADLARSQAWLRECVDGEQVVGLRAMARMRHEVRELEAKQRELTRLVAALDRRFSARWSREG
jgi:hypothetical protein